MWNEVETVLSEAFGRLRAVLAADLPGIVAMILVIAATIAFAFAARALLRSGLRRIGIDRRAREWGMTTRRNIEPHHEPSWLIARGAFWFILASGIAIALAVLGASSTSAVGLALLTFLPKVVVGAIVLLVGIGAARFLERSVLIGAVNRQIQQARIVALAVKWLVLILAAAMALQHVGIGGWLPTIAFVIVVGGLVLAGALAFGLGARNAVARLLDRPAPDETDGARDEPEADRIHHL